MRYWLVVLLLASLGAQAALRPAVHERLQDARARAEAGHGDAALAALESLTSELDLTGEERARVDELRGYLHYQAGRHDAALSAYQAVAANPDTPAPLLDGTRRALLWLYYDAGRMDRALAQFRALAARHDSLTPDLHVLGATVLHGAGEHRAAADHWRRAVAGREARGEAVPDAWLSSWRASLQAAGDYRAAARVQNRLVNRSPSPEHLLALAGLYGRAGEPRKQVAVLESLYENDQLPGTDALRTLIALYQRLDRPLQAARALDTALRDGALGASRERRRRLAGLWLQAREQGRALATLERLVEDHPDADLYLQLARLHNRAQRWGEAADALGQALARGVDDRADTLMALGVARYRQGRRAAARDAFEQARRHAARRADAEQWLAHLSRQS